TGHGCRVAMVAVAAAGGAAAGARGVGALAGVGIKPVSSMAPPPLAPVTDHSFAFLKSASPYRQTSPACSSSAPNDRPPVPLVAGFEAIFNFSRSSSEATQLHGCARCATRGALTLVPHTHQHESATPSGDRRPGS